MAQIWEYIKIALMNIRSNKGRSILTMLGIIIGISSVIMVISIGDGVRGQVNDELDSMGNGLIGIGVDTTIKENTVRFTQDDFNMIMEKVEHVKGVSPVNGGWGTAEGPKGDFEATVTAGSEGLVYYGENGPVIKGRYFSRADYDSGNKVCLLTESSAISLFGTTDVIGMSFDLTLYGITQEMTVVGIRENSASSIVNAGMGNMYIQIEMPVSVLGNSYNFWVEDFNQFYVFAESNDYVVEVAKKCVSLLENKYNVRGEGQIMVQSFQDVAAQYDSMLGMITVFISFVAAISLLVGGIGVMNIMLVSVTERTREIGIRKSLGARTGSILMQFLAEASIITLMGGLIGITLGILGAHAVCSAMDFKARIEVSTVLIATLFSSAVGIFFGIYPARKAAKLSPIEALRRE